MKKILIISAFVALLASCTKEIALNLPSYSSKLVVNGEFDSDNTIALTISRSMPILQKIDSTGFLIKDATVKIYENGIYFGDAVYTGGKYTLNKKPSDSKTYAIEVTSPVYPKAVANLIMPDKVIMTASYTDSVGLDKDGFKVGQVKLTFNDNGLVNNYYKMLIRWYNAPALEWSPMPIKSGDVIFLNNTKLNDGSYIFSDRTFQGKTKTLYFETSSAMGTGTPKFEISLKTFNEDFYNYLRQVDNYSQSGNGVSAEAVIMRSNVTNGLGMVGGVSNAKDTIF